MTTEIRVVACIPDASAPAEALPGCLVGEIYQPVLLQIPSFEAAHVTAAHYELAAISAAVVVATYLIATGFGAAIKLFQDIK